MKNFLSAFIFFIIACTLPANAMQGLEPFIPKHNEIVFNQATRSISVIDPNCTNNPSCCRFPGMRGTNQLIIYTPEFGRRTNTNEFGTEALVVDGVVTQLSGANTRASIGQGKVYPTVFCRRNWRLCAFIFGNGA